MQGNWGKIRQPDTDWYDHVLISVAASSEVKVAI